MESIMDVPRAFTLTSTFPFSRDAIIPSFLPIFTANSALYYPNAATCDITVFTIRRQPGDSLKISLPLTIYSV